WMEPGGPDLWSAQRGAGHGRRLAQRAAELLAKLVFTHLHSPPARPRAGAPARDARALSPRVRSRRARGRRRRTAGPSSSAARWRVASRGEGGCPRFGGPAPSRRRALAPVTLHRAP